MKDVLRKNFGDSQCFVLFPCEFNEFMTLVESRRLDISKEQFYG